MDIATLAVSGLLLLAAVGCGRGEGEETATAPDVATVERRDLVVRAEAAGLVEPVRVVEVKSKVSGELLRVTVETGDEVQQGTLLAEVDPRDVRNAFAQAEADTGLAAARVETAAAQRRRAEELAKAGLLSSQDLENTRLEETNARAQLLKARTNLELAREKTGDVSIRAPITGTIIEKTVEQGQIVASASANVSGGTTLVKMADLAMMQVRALVDETDIGRVQPGQPVEVTVEAHPGRTFRGEVAKIEPQAVIDQNVTMFPVLVRLANPERLLKPGMNAEVAVQIADRQDVVAVPNAAVVSLRDAPAAGAVLGLDEDELRSQLARMRQSRGGGAAPAADRGGSAPASGRSGGERGAEARGDGSTRPGIVFVKSAAGVEPRFVQLGLSDWDSTEVVRGVEPGESVYLVSVARLQRQQEEFASRIRERAGGGFLGGGGGGQRGAAGGAGAAGGTGGGRRP